MCEKAGFPLRRRPLFFCEADSAAFSDVQYTEKWSANEIATAINKYRMLHLQDLTRVSVFGSGCLCCI
jgi:hypothetical protein